MSDGTSEQDLPRWKALVVKVFCGEEFRDHEHEWNQFKEIYELTLKQYSESDEHIYVLANFLLSNAQIDVLILTERGPAILELKSYKGLVCGSENGEWSVFTEEKEVNLGGNLFQQLQKQRFAFVKKLEKVRTGHFERIQPEKLFRIQCWGYFEKGSIYDRG